MFGPSLSKVFASRNNALWWSAMVLVTAYCVAAEPPATVDIGPQNSEMPQEKTDSSGDPWG